MEITSIAEPVIIWGSLTGYNKITRSEINATEAKMHVKTTAIQSTKGILTR